MDKPIKPTDLIPRSFGGVKNNFSASLQATGYEDGVPAIYGGDNLNYQLNATGKELDYCEKICDYINAIPINKTPVVDANNKLVYTQYDIRVYNSTETYNQNDYLSGFVNGKKHIYRCKQDNTTGQPLSNDTYFEQVDIMGNVKTIGRNIGEIVASTIPLTDAGLHLLDGSVIQGDGIYSAFVDYIAGIYDPTANYFCTEVEWQTAVTTYGVCGKFVYDSVNNTVRLPKYGTQIFTKGCTFNTANTVPVVGNGKGLGLTDGTNTGTLINNSSDNNFGKATNVNVGTSISNIYTKSDKAIGVTTDPTKSGLVANTTSVASLTDYPLDCYYYIVVSTSTKTNIEVDIDEIVTDLNGKADTDFSNVNNTAKITMSEMGMPSGVSKDLTLGTNGSNYTAPADGWVSLTKHTSTAGQYISISCNEISVNSIGYSSGQGLSANLAVKSGATFNVGYSAGGTTDAFRFVYAEGSKSLNT